MTYFAKGKKYRGLANSTIQRLKKAGYTQVVWFNGDFFCL